jgi:hypothetical protein
MFHLRPPGGRAHAHIYTSPHVLNLNRKPNHAPVCILGTIRHSGTRTRLCPTPLHHISFAAHTLQALQIPGFNTLCHLVTRSITKEPTVSLINWGKWARRCKSSLVHAELLHMECGCELARFLRPTLTSRIVEGEGGCLTVMSLNFSVLVWLT